MAGEFCVPTVPASKSAPQDPLGHSSGSFPHLGETLRMPQERAFPPVSRAAEGLWAAALWKGCARVWGMQAPLGPGSEASHQMPTRPKALGVCWGVRVGRVPTVCQA